MTKTLIAGVALVGALSLTSCSEPPKAGVVVSTEFNAAHEDSYLYCAVWISHRVGSVTTTTCSYYATGYDHVPDRWRLKLQDPKGRKGWRGVAKAVYDRCPMDASYPLCATG